VDVGTLTEVQAIREFRKCRCVNRVVALLALHSDSGRGGRGSRGAWGGCREDHRVGQITTTALGGGTAVVGFAVACTRVFAITTVVAIVVL
jgi:hypothetical protein